MQIPIFPTLVPVNKVFSHRFHTIFSLHKVVWGPDFLTKIRWDQNFSDTALACVSSIKLPSQMFSSDRVSFVFNNNFTRIWHL